MKQYRYALLDWDGTLARSLDVWFEAMRTSLENHGHNFADNEIGANFDVFKERFESAGHGNADGILDEASKISDKNIPTVELYPNAVKTLESLRDSGVKIALVTTSTHEWIDPLLKKHDLNRFFDAVICGDDTENQKPHPEPIQKALADLNADPATAVMIGDSNKDINAAHNAGIDSILFYPPDHENLHQLEQLKKLKPSFIIQDLHQLNTIILGE